LEDNTALISALEQSDQVIPLFIFDPVLLPPKNSNRNALQFMIESLKELTTILERNNAKLYLAHGYPHKVIQQITDALSIDAIFANKDYSPYSRTRKKKLETVANTHNIDYLEYSDYVLVNPESIYTNTGGRYSVFTYFFKKAINTEQIKSPQSNTHQNYFTDDQISANAAYLDQFSPKPNPELFIHGGRTNGLDILKQIPNLSDYQSNRDYPAEDATSHLSAHHKFGTISIRESYQNILEKLGKDHELIRQLFWRDFYIYLAVHYNHVFHRSFQKKYDKINWSDNKEAFQRWCEGRTGFPIVDAGMRQLNQTGYMHNRVRMIVASFLVKDLHLNWQWGEQYFAEKLVDYDIMVNNGNWQWAASTGADAQPYFRIFNPWSQQEKYDKQAKYIKEYIPELADMPAKGIHRLHTQRPLGLEDYPTPIVNHKEEAKKAKAIFKSVV